MCFFLVKTTYPCVHTARANSLCASVLVYGIVSFFVLLRFIFLCYFTFCRIIELNVAKDFNKLKRETFRLSLNSTLQVIHTHIHTVVSYRLSSNEARANREQRGKNINTQRERRRRKREREKERDKHASNRQPATETYTNTIDQRVECAICNHFFNLIV